MKWRRSNSSSSSYLREKSADERQLNPFEIGEDFVRDSTADRSPREEGEELSRIRDSLIFLGWRTAGGEGYHLFGWRERRLEVGLFQDLSSGLFSENVPRSWEHNWRNISLTMLGSDGSLKGFDLCSIS